ncbi:MAG: ferritin-like domain-containing protein, partial [Myxococcales bacterium]|nr:ferritin-like domain-containing protein [Myxococcales bacterium]
MFARAAWPMRAADELRSARIFRALARAARTARIPEPWPARFADALRDELRHTRLCTELGRRFGADPPNHDARPVRSRLEALRDPVGRVVSLLLVEVAIGETISTMLFHAGRRRAVEPLTRAALAAILRDEARHQRLGWDALGVVWPDLSDEQRARA